MFSCLLPAHSSSQAGTIKAAHALGAEEALALGNCSKQAWRQEIKYLLPVTSAPAWQAAWDSPLLPRRAEGGCDREGV